MGKRSDMPRKNARGFYPTPVEAVRPLIPYLPEWVPYWEPCAGEGHLEIALHSLGQTHCVQATDIRAYPKMGVDAVDVRSICSPGPAKMFITNPPWPEGGKRGDPALSIALHLSDMLPTWLLLPWDFAANRYFSKLRDRCVKIVPIGRVSWEGNGVPGKDNCAWYLFDARHESGPVVMARAA